MSQDSAKLQAQIEEKKKLLEVAKKRVESVLENSSSSENDSRAKIVSLVEVLKRVPYRPAEDDLIGRSLAEAHLIEEIGALDKVLGKFKKENDTKLHENLETETQLSKIYDELNQHLEVRIGEREKERQQLNMDIQDNTGESLDKKYSTVAEEIDELRDRSKQLAEFTKVLVKDYILKNEFTIFDYETQMKQKTDRFLKLLEILLNNALTSPSQGSEKTLEVANKDDPLIRYLIVNNIVVVDKRNANRIKLRI
ncbi:hypothetical protein FOA43_004789 [Brettanomyces nanus]|uniref:Uncharacterized protein n=1 Tax=Eeniella nana TaxID=13502 RepID=A0A875S7P7_EENNA|nr:uncharacterized protein FOA43_004789 [Brettanomyces nanus]QPG77376.1 hypothetical protein FOA43_004789 [Brettanomyces nanus]